MKKLSLMALSLIFLAGMSSCEDKDKPTIDTTRHANFVLNTPQLATQFIDLSTEGVLSFSVSQPDYGLTVAPSYGLQISLTEDFNPISDEQLIDADGNLAVDDDGNPMYYPAFYTLKVTSQLGGILTADMSDVAMGINELNGLLSEDMYTEDYEGPLYVRATASLGVGAAAEATATVSNVITLSQVRGYSIFPPAAILLGVPGNGNGWDESTPRLLMVEDNADGMFFRGFAYISGEFKITDGDWNGSGNWGADDDGLVEEANPETGEVSWKGNLLQNTGNFNIGGASLSPGMYYFEVTVTDFENGTDGAKVGTMVVTPVWKVSIIGGFCNWDIASAVEMTLDAESTYSATGSFTDGWKIYINDNEKINLGGKLKEPEFNGENFTEEASDIVLQLGQYPWVITVE